MAGRTELTETEQRFKAQMDELVKQRAEAVRAQQGLTTDIAALCVEAREHNITMGMLASWVQVLDVKEDKLRPVSRQSVDQLVAAYEKRERAPRRTRAMRRRDSETNGGGPRMAAFT
jgi:hypothetical protein